MMDAATLFGLCASGLVGLGLYALIVNFISSRTVDMVQQGVSYARSVTIVSTQPNPIRAALMAELDRGVTVLTGQGGYTNMSYQVLLCVVARSQLDRLKRIVSETDPEAFVIVSEAHEVLGQGFRPIAAQET